MLFDMVMLNIAAKPDYTTLSAVMLTHNRAERCSDCARNTARAMENHSAQLLIINNGTEKPEISSNINGIPCRVIDSGRNMGAEARNLALSISDSEFLLMLDDDAYISEDSIKEMIDTFRSDPKIGAVAFRVKNPAGEESCLLPTVFLGCACAFRAEALKAIGGYPRGFLYYGEEYHVAFRLYHAGYKMMMMDDPDHVFHLRDTRGRNINRIIRLLIRNNTMLWTASFPYRHIIPAINDTLKRYFLVSRKENALSGYIAGLLTLPLSIIRGLLSRNALPSEIFSRIMLVKQLEDTCEKLRTSDIREVIICGTGKFPSLWLETMRRYGIKVRAFMETNECWQEKTINNIPVKVISSNTIKLVAPNLDNDCAYLIGLSSLGEAYKWQNLLSSSGLMNIYNSGEAEISADPGKFDLLDSPLIKIFKKAYCTANKRQYADFA